MPVLSAQVYGPVLPVEDLRRDSRELPAYDRQSMNPKLWAENQGRRCSFSYVSTLSLCKPTRVQLRLNRSAFRFRINVTLEVRNFELESVTPSLLHMYASKR